MVKAIGVFPKRKFVPYIVQDFFVERIGEDIFLVGFAVQQFAQGVHQGGIPAVVDLGADLLQPG